MTELKEIISLPRFTDILPLVFQNGSKVEDLIAVCSCCGGDVSKENTHVRMNTMEHVVALEGFALCFNCKVITPFALRLRGDGTMLSRGPDGWNESRYAPENKVGVLSKLKSLRDFMAGLM